MAVLPLTVFTVITAVPVALAVTLPVLLTVATLLLLVDQVQVLFLAFAGKTVLIKPYLSPMPNVRLLWFSFNPVGTAGSAGAVPLTNLKPLSFAYLSAAVPFLPYMVKPLILTHCLLLYVYPNA